MKVIKKVLNSSVVLVKDNQNNDFILTGKGIGYGRKQGEVILDSEENQLFLLVSSAKQKILFDLVQRVPEEMFVLSEVIVDYAETKIGKPLPVNIHYTLADHISFAIERLQSNINITNRLFWEMKTFYAREFEIGLFAVSYINKTMNVELPEEEAANIAFHIANVTGAFENSYDSMKAARLIREVTDLIQYSLNRTINKEGIHYERFITHIKYFVERALSDKMLQDNNVLYEKVEIEYSESMKIAHRVAGFLLQNHDINVSKDEMTFLAIHIDRIRSDIKRG